MGVVMRRRLWKGWIESASALYHVGRETDFRPAPGLACRTPGRGTRIHRYLPSAGVAGPGGDLSSCPSLPLTIGLRKRSPCPSWNPKKR